MSGAGEGPHPERVGPRPLYTGGKTGWYERPFLAMGAAAFAAGWLAPVALTVRSRLIARFCTSARPTSSTVVAGAIAMIPLFPICDTSRPVVTIVSQG